MLGKMNPMHISSDHSHTNCSSDWRIYNCVIPSSLIPMFPSTFRLSFLAPRKGIQLKSRVLLPLRILYAKELL